MDDRAGGAHSCEGDKQNIRFIMISSIMSFVLVDTVVIVQSIFVSKLYTNFRNRNFQEIFHFSNFAQRLRELIVPNS